MAGQFSFTLQDYQTAAIKYRKELLMLPIIGIERTLKFMTGRPGIRYKEAVGTLLGDAQFAPYKPNRSHDFDLTLDHRVLETYFANVVEKFEPNSAVSTVLGAIGATKGEGQAQVPTAKHVLALIARRLSHHLNASIFKAKRNASGDTTMDLFDGFDTITEAEITAGKIAAALGNYMKLEEEITTANAVDTFKTIMWALDEILREQKLYIYCSQDILDKYNEDYKLVTGAIPYNREYGQTYVEGSGGNLIFCPLSNKRGSKFIHISDKANMLVGYDQMGDVESIEVERFEPFVLSYIATMFFGVQFESIDKSRLMVVEQADEDADEDSDQNSNDNGSDPGDNTNNGGADPEDNTNNGGADPDPNTNG